MNFEVVYYFYTFQLQLWQTCYLTLADMEGGLQSSSTLCCFSSPCCQWYEEDAVSTDQASEHAEEPQRPVYCSIWTRIVILCQLLSKSFVFGLELWEWVGAGQFGTGPGPAVGSRLKIWTWIECFVCSVCSTSSPRCPLPSRRIFSNCSSEARAGGEDKLSEIFGRQGLSNHSQHSGADAETANKGHQRCCWAGQWKFRPFAALQH